MRIYRQRMIRGQFDHERFWLFLSVSLLVTGGIWLALGLPWPSCPFLRLTGHPCASCGATRAAIQFFHGNFGAAFLWNPLACVLLCAVMLFDAYAAVMLLSGAPRWRVGGLSSAQKISFGVLLVSALALNWAYLLIHSHKFLVTD